MEHSESPPVPLIIVIPAVVGLAIIALIGWQYYQSAVANARLVLSGTIEATYIHLGTQLGGEVKQVYVNEGDYVGSGEHLLSLYSATSGANEVITTPLSGTIMERLIELGELAAPGNTLVIVADLEALNLTVYVPEDRLGYIMLGEAYPVTVDSYPELTFTGTVRQIADEAEFTPRNVQTVEGRKTTVFAVELAMGSSGGRLKPGMPADVTIALN